MPNMKKSINPLFCGIEDRTVQCIEICVHSSQDWKFRIYDLSQQKKSCFLMSSHNPHDLLLFEVEHHLVVRSPMKYIALSQLYW
jgi:hypothetical protein